MSVIDDTLNRFLFIYAFVADLSNRIPRLFESGLACEHPSSLLFDLALDASDLGVGEECRFARERLLGFGGLVEMGEFLEPVSGFLGRRRRVAVNRQ